MGALQGRGLPNRLGATRSKLRKAVDPEGGQRRSRNWYSTSEWRRLRVEILKRDGYVCQQTGVALVGKYPAWNSPVVDHRVPHRGDRSLFFDPNNLQAVSKQWHDGEKQGLEKRGEVGGW